MKKPKKPKKTTLTARWYFTTWLVKAEYKGGPDGRDAVCVDLAGHSAGTGYDLTRGTRDLNWEFRSERPARSAAEALLWIRGVKVLIRGPHDARFKKFDRARPLRSKRTRKAKA
jgi:hypothetical protein